MPYQPEVRKEKISEITKGKPVRTGERLFGGGRKDVYAVPLEYLTYNPKNTRFLAEAKTFEADEGRTLDISDPRDFAKIEDFIWKYRQERNESTIKSLLQNGQQKPGIVTRDGIVLSGNRRLRLLNEIRRNPAQYQRQNPERFEELSKFEAIVLDESDMTPEKIISMETYYQYGEDEKVDYNPIQLYLSANQQKNELGLQVEQIASNFKVSKAKVHTWLEVYNLMVEYLDYTGQKNRFIALDELEDPFLSLNRTLKKLANGSAQVNWAYDEVDIEDMKLVYFDYLYAQEKGEKKYRDLLDFFNDKKEWEAIKTAQGRLGTPTDELKPLSDYEKENPDLSPEKVIEKRRSDFVQLNATTLGQGFREARRMSFNNEVEAKPSQKVEELQTLTAETLDYLKRMNHWGKEVTDKAHVRNILDQVSEDIAKIRAMLED
jgi:hypothetical protein